MKKYFQFIDYEANSYLKNIGVTGLGVVLSTLIVFLTTPILSRVFTPTAYGVAGMYSNILTYLLLFSGLMLPQAIVVVQNKRKLYRLISSIKTLLLLSVVLTTIGLVISKDVLQAFLNDESDGTWIYLLPLGLLFSQISNVATLLHVRGELFETNTKVSIGNSIIGRGGSILGGYLANGHYLILVIASLLNLFTSLIWYAWKDIKRIVKLKLSFVYLKQSLNEFRDYPLFILPSNILSVLSITAPFFVFSIYHSPALAGIFLFTENVILFPFRMAGKAITPVYLQRIAKLYASDFGAFQKTTEQTFFGLFVAGVIPFSLLTIFGPELFDFVFGPEWKEGGVMAQYLSFYVLLRMCSSPLSAIYRVAEQEKSSLLTQLVLFVGRVLPLVFGLLYLTYHQALLLFAIGGSLGYYFHFYQLCKIAKLPFVKLVLLQAIGFMLMCTLFLVLKYSF